MGSIRGTHCREVAQREDAEKGGLATGSISDDNQLPV